MTSRIRTIVSFAPRLVARVLFSLVLFATAASHASPPAHLWSKNFGSTSSDRINAIGVDANGNIFVTGSFAGSVSFGGSTLVSAGSTDVFVAKYDAHGNHLWSFRYGGTGADSGDALAVDIVGRVVVAGEFGANASFGGTTFTNAGSRDIFVAKYDANGAHVWSAAYGSTGDDIPLGVAVSNVQQVYVTGYFNGTVNFGGGGLVSAGGDDAFLLKLSSSGGYLQSFRFGSTSTDIGTAVAVDVFFNVFFCGQFTGSVNFGGGIRTSAGGTDIYLAEYSESGSHIFDKRFGGTSTDDPLALAVDTNSNVLMTGGYLSSSLTFGGATFTNSGNYDIFLAKFDNHLSHVWSKKSGGTGIDEGIGLATDTDRNVLLTGHVNTAMDFGGGLDPLVGGSDVFVAEYNENGAYRWSTIAGGASSDFGLAVAAGAENRFVTGGYFQSTMNLGGADLVSAGSLDAYLASFGQNGPQPLIDTVTDVGNDQGRAVKVRFLKSGKDDAFAVPPVVGYEIYRRDAAPPAFSTGVVRDDGWTWVATVPAHGKHSYAADVPTIGDSTLTLGQYLSVFKVRATKTDPSVFYDSPPDSGYSVDNLAPGIPQNFVYNTGNLTWKESSDADFKFFTVYGSNTTSFAGAVLINYTTGTAMNVHTSTYPYYFITATDFSGNEGRAALANNPSTVGDTPRSYVLSLSNYPNPFNPRTTLKYTVPSRGTLDIEIYDAHGAHIATLFHGERNAGAYSVEWDGRGASGAVVSSGVYFARIEQSGAVRTKKMVLLK